MAIQVISVGKKHSNQLVAAIEDYQKRLRPPFDVKWVLLAPSSQNGLEAAQNESQTILKRLKPDEYVILLDESGTPLTSPDFSKLLQGQFSNSHKVTLIIGGAYGVDEVIKIRADFIWSLSPLVFPHQLVRLILTEQVYRAQAIASASAYHHA